MCVGMFVTTVVVCAYVVRYDKMYTRRRSRRCAVLLKANIHVKSSLRAQIFVSYEENVEWLNTIFGYLHVRSVSVGFVKSLHPVDGCHKIK